MQNLDTFLSQIDKRREENKLRTNFALNFQKDDPNLQRIKI